MTHTKFVKLVTAEIEKAFWVISENGVTEITLNWNGHADTISAFLGSEHFHSDEKKFWAITQLDIHDYIDATEYIQLRLDSIWNAWLCSLSNWLSERQKYINV